MARYIDADKLCEALKSMADVQYPEKQNTILGVVSSIENFRTADVVTRAELAREIFGDVKKAIKEEVRDYCKGFENMETPEMQEYYKTKQNTAIYLYMKIDHLEKKYTEGAADNGCKQ